VKRSGHEYPAREGPARTLDSEEVCAAPAVCDVALQSDAVVVVGNEGPADAAAMPEMRPITSATAGRSLGESSRAGHRRPLQRSDGG